MKNKQKLVKIMENVTNHKIISYKQNFKIVILFKLIYLNI